MKKLKKWMLAGTVALIVCSAGTVNAQGGITKYFFLNEGDGLAVFVQSGETNLLFDGGDAAHAPSTVQFLKDLGISKIDYMVCSCAERDHVEGLKACLDEFDVGILLAGYYSNTTTAYSEFMNAAVAKGVKIMYPNAGQTFTMGENEVKILSGNTNVITMRLSQGEISALLAGDMQAEDRKRILANKENLQSDILCLPQHGADGTNDEDLLDAVNPAYAVISCERNGIFGNPSALVLNELEARQIDLYRTDLQGSIAAVSNGVQVKWTTDPCEDYSPGTFKAFETQSQNQSVTAPVEETDAAENAVTTVAPQASAPVEEVADQGEQTQILPAQKPGTEEEGAVQNQTQETNSGDYTVTTVTTYYTTYTTYYY